MKRPHDRACWHFFQHLVANSEHVAIEAGLPHGRVDVVRLDEDGHWVELYEVKLRLHEAGIAQLRRYAAQVDGDPILTLVVDVATPSLYDKAARAGVRVHQFDFGCEFQLPLIPTAPVRLPYVHREQLRAAQAKRRDWISRHVFRNNRWIEVPA